MENPIFDSGSLKPPRISYIVCTTPRSGSTFLCEALKQTKLAGRPDEYFLHWHRAANNPKELDKYGARAIAMDRYEYIKEVIARGTVNQVFGIKIMQNYLDLILSELQRFSSLQFSSKAELLKFYFPNLQYIYLTRKDKVRQAVSWAKAVQSGEWESYYWTPFTRVYKQLMSRNSRPAFNFEQIRSYYELLCEQSGKWEAFFRECRIEPYRIEYESFIYAFDETIHGILDFLKVLKPKNLTFPRPAYRRQSNAVNEEWTRRFLEGLKN